MKIVTSLGERRLGFKKAIEAVKGAVPLEKFLPVIDGSATYERERRVEIYRVWKDFQSVSLESLLNGYLRAA